MDTRLPAEAISFGEIMTERFRALGGVELARRAERDLKADPAHASPTPTARAQAKAVLDDAGIGDIDVRKDADQLIVGAMLCRAAGAVALPWPVVPDLLRIDGKLLAIVDPAAIRVDHGTAEATWVGTDLDGHAWTIEPTDAATGLLGPFVTTGRTVQVVADVDPDDIARHLALGAWSILGAAEAVLADAREHLRVRRQFGTVLASFQALRFSFADAVVAVRGLEELAKFATWQLTTGSGPGPQAWARATRLHANRVGTTTIRACHQFYGALGLCDETDMSIIDRHLQPTLRYGALAQLNRRFVADVASRTLAP